MPTELVYYDSLPITGASGTFTSGETITGGTSSATGTLYADNGTTLFLQDVNGTFTDTETISGSSSGETATVNGSITERVQSLEWADRHLFLAAQAATVFWHKFKNNSQVATESALLDNLIQQNGIIEDGREQANWSLA